MGFDKGLILLDRGDAVYGIGETVTGRIIFNQEKPVTIHGIYVTFKPYCQIHWTSTKDVIVKDNKTSVPLTRVGTRRFEDIGRGGVNVKKEEIIHQAYEQYLNKKKFLFGDSSGQHHLRVGNHEFLFDCPIPKNCPSSFEGKHGHIRYELEVVMMTTGYYCNINKKVLVKVSAPVDLNMNPYCKEPLEYEIVNSYCSWCVNVGSAKIVVKVPRAGYCPEDLIPIDVKVTNNSSVEIKLIKFAITKFKAVTKPGVKREISEVVSIKKGSVAGGKTRSWNLLLKVPAMEVVNLDLCKFIDVSHHLQVSTKVGSFHSNSEESQRIIIGSVPLRVLENNPQSPRLLATTQNVQMPCSNGHLSNIMDEPILNLQYSETANAPTASNPF